MDEPDTKAKLIDAEIKEIGKRIRRARLARKMTLTQLGGDDLSRSFLSLIEGGKSRISIKSLFIVADALDLPMSYFFGDEDDKSPLPSYDARVTSQTSKKITIELTVQPQ